MDTQEATGRRSDRHGDVFTVNRPSPRTLLAALLVALAIVVLLDVVAFVSGRESAEHFSINGDFTLAMWWASVQLLIFASVLSLVALRELRSGRRNAALTLGLGALTAVFWSLDKIAGLKETIIDVLRTREPLASLTTGSTIWVLLGSVTVIVLLALILPGIMSLLGTDRTNTLLAAIGAAMNLLASTVVEAAYRTESHAQMLTEEAVEFLGIAILVWAIYRMLGSTEIRSPMGSVKDTR